MLEKSDRLRILCAVLDLDFDGFLHALGTQRGGVSPKLKETATDWWRHVHQPTKGADDIIKVLQQRANDKGIELKVAEAWTQPVTAGEFVELCGTTIPEVLPVLSDVGRRTCTEPFERLPFLKTMLEDREADPTATSEILRRMSGSYFLYRMHSSVRKMCKEPLWIEKKVSAVSIMGSYQQYAEGGGQRQIDLSVFVGDSSLHAVGAHRNGQNNGRLVSSIIHATIFSSAFRERLYGGIILGLTDDRTSVAAERILLEKVGKAHSNTVLASVVRNPEEEEKKFERFLNDKENDDPFFLLAHQSLFGRKVERNTPKSRKPRQI